MYRIFLDDELFYDPRIPDLALTDISCELEVNKTGTLKFTIPPTHPKKDDLKKMYSVLSLYQDDDWLYSGRVLSDEIDFYGSRTIECEGELSYLLDSIQRYHEYHDISVRDYFTDLIANHNLDVESRKEFTVGQVTVVDNNDSLYRYSTYENTWKTIEDRLISRLGGYIRIRHENGQRLIDYIESYGHTNEQVIRFGENVLDLIQEVDCDSLATVIVPLGKRDEETDERLTIKSVNGGKDYIEDPDAIAKYGRIVKTVEYDDVELPENLLRKGREVLDRQKVLISSITITAIDLHLLDVDIERCKVGDNIRVVSEPHGLDDFMVIQKIYLDLLHPENSKLTLGATLLTLASSMSRGTAAVLTSLQENFTAFRHVVTDKLQATNADVGALHVDLAEVDNLLAQKANVTDLNATNANVAALQAADAQIQHLVAEKAAITDLNATNANVSSLQASTANIESLLAGNAGVGTLQAIHLTGDNIVIDDATIAQAIMDDLMAGRVTAKTIYTDFITIASRDGSLSIEGSTIQIKDQNNTVRVQIPDLALTDISCELEVNKSGTLKFTIPPTHPKKDDLKKMYSVLSLYQDDDWLYSGRVLSDEIDFYGSRTIECEGELSYLLDSIQRYHEYHDISVQDYFSDLIANHNLDVESRKEFTVGQVTVADNNDSLYRYSTYENTWKTIEDRLISRLGGYIRIRHENGHRLIDYIESYNHTNDQVIRFGENVLDLIQEVNCDSLATIIVPLGKRDEETDERLTIKSVNLKCGLSLTERMVRNG